MESKTTSEKAQDALDQIHDRNRQRSNALSLLSGKLQFYCDTQDSIDVEKVKRLFNETVEECDGPVPKIE